MHDWIVTTLTQYPILTLFVVIGLGYVLGEINFFGFRFGVAGVLFVGLAVGSLSPDIALPEAVLVLGLIIFVYTLGIQSGPAFFDSFKRQGYRPTLLAAGVLLFGAGLTFLCAWGLRLSGPRAAGLYAGALTNTPALAAVMERVQELALRENTPEEAVRVLSDQPVVAYSLAYPIGVIGLLLAFQLAQHVWRPEIKPGEEAPEIRVRTFIIGNPGIFGQTVGEVLRLHRDLGFVISRIQKRDGVTSIARSDTPLTQGDIVAVVGDETALERAQHIFGEPSTTHIELDRSQLDYRRVFVSSKQVVGKRIRDINLEDRLGAVITRVRRGDIDVVPAPDTRLEYGDRVRVLASRNDFAEVSAFFGDSIRGTAETDFGSVALGMVLGVFVGMLPIPVPGSTPVRLGLAGGPLMVALVLGKLEHTGRISWVIPVSANLTLRQIGLLLFLAGIGTKAGYVFAHTIGEQGLPLLLAGAAVTLGVTFTTLVVGYKLMGLPFDHVMGLSSGVQTQPAALAFASNMAKTEAPNVGYASVYPAAMILKIVLAQLLLAWAGK